MCVLLFLTCINVYVIDHVNKETKKKIRTKFLYIHSYIYICYSLHKLFYFFIFKKKIKIFKNMHRQIYAIYVNIKQKKKSLKYIVHFILKTLTTH